MTDEVPDESTVTGHNHEHRHELEAELTAQADSHRSISLDRLEGRLRTKLADWRGLLSRNVEDGRSVLRALRVGH